MHNESIHRYGKPRPLVTPTASRNVLGKLLSLIPSKLAASLSFVVHAHGGGLLSVGPQQWDNAQYLALSSFVPTNRTRSSDLSPTSISRSAGICSEYSSMMVLDMLQRHRSCGGSSVPDCGPPSVHLLSHRLIIAIVRGPSSGSAHSKVDISRSVPARLSVSVSHMPVEYGTIDHQYIPSSAQTYTL
jgi:hypothetical protein